MRRAIDGLGLVSVIEGWMNVIADEFVHKTRFDPTHAGATEQQVFDTIFAWLGQPTLSEQRIRISFGEGTRELDISPGQLQGKLRQRLLGADLGDYPVLAITPRIGQVPFLADQLRSSVERLIPLSDDDAGMAFAELGRQATPGQVRRINQALSSMESVTTDRSQRAPTTLAATHLLLGHTAHALSDPAFAACIDPHSATTLGHEISVNGHARLGTRIAPGDTVDLNGNSYLAIRVE